MEESQMPQALHDELKVDLEVFLEQVKVEGKEKAIEETIKSIDESYQKHGNICKACFERVTE